MKAIKCIKDQAKFDALNAKALSYCLANGGIMKRWCYPVIHPGTKEISFVVEDRILPCLTSIEKNQKIQLTKDWFPKGKII